MGSGPFVLLEAVPKMGLEDLVPEDQRGSSRSSSSSSRSKKKKKDTVVFGGGQYRKEFTEERWQEVKRTLVNEMGLVPNEVTNNFSAEERFETLHEAAMLSRQETTLEELGRSPSRCIVCGNAIGQSGTEVEGKPVHIHHTVGQVRSSLDEN